MESKTLAAADSFGNVYYHYLNENYNSTGYGRVDKQKRGIVDTDSCLSYIYTYSGSTDRVIQKQCYTDNNWSTLKLTYAYNDSATNRMLSKTFTSADGSGNNYYEYTDEGFYGTDDLSTTRDERYGRIYRQRTASTGSVVKRLDWYTGTEHTKKEEEYTSLAETTWVETRWYYDGASGTGNLSKKIASNGEAAIYFDTTGYKCNVYWSASGEIMKWASVADYDANKKAWYMDGTWLDVYTYYDSGRVKYVDSYLNSGGTWTWSLAEYRADSGSTPWGTWIGNVSRATTGASVNYTLPTKPTQGDASILSLELNNSAELVNTADTTSNTLQTGDQTTLDGILTVNAAKIAETASADNYTYAAPVTDSETLKNNLLPSVSQ
jgi:hypothetical protein